MHYIDTLFNIKNNDILKKYKGYYFLNEHRDNGTWVVNKLNPSRNSLIVSSISKEEDFESLEEITGEESEAPHTFKTSKTQFKDFVKGGGFKNDEVFIRN